SRISGSFLGLHEIRPRRTLRTPAHSADRVRGDHGPGQALGSRPIFEGARHPEADPRTRRVNRPGHIAAVAGSALARRTGLPALPFEGRLDHVGEAVARAPGDAREQAAGVGYQLRRVARTTPLVGGS